MLRAVLLNRMELDLTRFCQYGGVCEIRVLICVRIDRLEHILEICGIWIRETKTFLVARGVSYGSQMGQADMTEYSITFMSPKYFLFSTTSSIPRVNHISRESLRKHFVRRLWNTLGLFLWSQSIRYSFYLNEKLDCVQ